MEDKLIEILEDFGYPVLQQGSMLPEEDYPAHFFTFWNDDSDGDSFFDNNENATVWTYSINFYSSDPELVVSKLKEVISSLRENEFIVSGKGHSVASDEKTHTGRGTTVQYRENN